MNHLYLRVCHFSSNPQNSNITHKAIEESIGRKLELQDINNTTLIHTFIMDLCNNSTPENGLMLSSKILSLMKFIKEFNYKYIYNNAKLSSFKDYTNIIINTIYKNLLSEYDNIKVGKWSLNNIRSGLLKSSFYAWLDKYSFQTNDNYKNRIQFNVSNEKEYKRSIVYFISGMTDNFAISIFNELNSF